MTFFVIPDFITIDLIPLSVVKAINCGRQLLTIFCAFVVLLFVDMLFLVWRIGSYASCLPQSSVLCRDRAPVQVSLIITTSVLIIVGGGV